MSSMLRYIRLNCTAAFNWKPVRELLFALAWSTKERTGTTCRQRGGRKKKQQQQHTMEEAGHSMMPSRDYVNILEFSSSWAMTSSRLPASPPPPFPPPSKIPIKINGARPRFSLHRPISSRVVVFTRHRVRAINRAASLLPVESRRGIIDLMTAT